MRRTAAHRDTEDQGSLYKRYLLWLYKTTRDELDKIDRKFTQLDIDRHLAVLLKRKSGHWAAPLKSGISVFLKEWQEYIDAKERDARKLKYGPDGELDARYLFLSLKLEAIVDIIRRRFGPGGLRALRRLYEESSIQRILEDVSGKR